MWPLHLIFSCLPPAQSYLEGFQQRKLQQKGTIALTITPDREFRMDPFQLSFPSKATVEDVREAIFERYVLLLPLILCSALRFFSLPPPLLP